MAENSNPFTKDTRFDTRGIVSALSRIGFTTNNFFKSIGEYIWNGFDAGATVVELNYELSQSKKEGYFRKLSIKDNGKGINHPSLGTSFEPIFDSEKLSDDYSGANHSAIHGKNGIGRLTFYTFSNFAKWITIYNDESNKKYEIKIDANTLNKFSGNTDVPQNTKENTGTLVSFDGFEKIKRDDIENSLIEHLAREFAWYLELHPDFKLIINSKEMEYEFLIEDRDSIEFKYENKDLFEIRYIKWKQLMNKEYSKFYFLNSASKEVWKENTKLNQQGDDFHHSVYIKSDYFNNFNFFSQEESKQKQLTKGARTDEEFQFFSTNIYSFLRKKRKPFLKKHSKVKLKEYKDEGIIRDAKKGTFEEIETKELESVFQGLYELQPKFFSSLKKEQKKIMIGFLDLLLKSDEREKVITIVDEIVGLDATERTELAELLKVTKLSKIVKTMNLIKERFSVIEILKQLVFVKELKANERDHLQKIVEDNYWIFGEEYHLVTKDENFQKALEKYTYILDGVSKLVNFKEDNKHKRMDIFLCRQKIEGRNHIKNVIVELKSPSIKLGSEQHKQVDTYRTTILKEDQFNNKNAKWDFILVGNKYDEFIQGLIDTNKGHGEQSLIFSVDNFKIYVKCWSEIFDEFNIAYNFLNSKLELEKEKLVEELSSANEGVEKATKK